ncbi:Smr/MutS family protein [uncultured Legionella sp.]|uniref:Smr/MutS family protein n=1 Tax=uncultured Legionella sp. TaxID=210934 RepID=UPI0026353E83|nr:Smr/MutS family protein [uncultured Legionella sp.]
MADDFMSDEDKALFREHMRSVKPLNDATKRTKAPERTQQQYSARKRNQEQSQTKSERYLSDYISETVLSHTQLTYCNPSVPSKRFRELRHGLIPWEARLDLHGLKTEDARESLCRFIQNQTKNNKRCLLIIHGKGGHLGAPPVIKNLINRWLPQFSEVLAFHSALAKDGGHGAIYVLLKRNKTEK